jgi:hypothetical protein
MKKAKPKHPEDQPAPSSSTSTIGPIIGVVDGSDAAPGEVGEFLTADVEFAYGAGGAGGLVTTGQIPLINMPPGDWDFTISATFSTTIGSALFYLNPKPIGMSNIMIGGDGNFGTMAVEGVAIIGQSARGSFSVTTLLSFFVEVFQVANGAGGNMDLVIDARRRR